MVIELFVEEYPNVMFVPPMKFTLSPDVIVALEVLSVNKSHPL
jgi:hypothetical protein